MIKSTQDFRRMAGTSLTKTSQPFRTCVFTFRVSRPTRVEWPHEVLRWEKRKPRAPTWSGCVRASRPALRRALTRRQYGARHARSGSVMPMLRMSSGMRACSPTNKEGGSIWDVLSVRVTLALYRRRAFRKNCARARWSGARSIKPLEGSRPWLRRTRAPMEIQLREGAVSRCAEAVRQSTTDDSGR